MDWTPWHLTPEHDKALHRITYLNDKYEVVGRDGEGVIVRFGIHGTAPTWLRVTLNESELPDDHPPIPDNPSGQPGEQTPALPEDPVRQ